MQMQIAVLKIVIIVIIEGVIIVTMATDNHIHTQVWKEIKDGAVTTAAAYDKLSEARYTHACMQFAYAYYKYIQARVNQAPLHQLNPSKHSLHPPQLLTSLTHAHTHTHTHEQGGGQKKGER